jgi:hypothetical protein
MQKRPKKEKRVRDEKILAFREGKNKISEEEGDMLLNFKISGTCTPYLLQYLCPPFFLGAALGKFFCYSITSFF